MLPVPGVVLLAWRLFLYFPKWLEPTGTAFFIAHPLLREFHDVAAGVVPSRVLILGAGPLQLATRVRP